MLNECLVCWCFKLIIKKWKEFNWGNFRVENLGLYFKIIGYIVIIVIKNLFNVSLILLIKFFFKIRFME